jgi:hypothetical protein
MTSTKLLYLYETITKEHTVSSQSLPLFDESLIMTGFTELNTIAMFS